MADEEGYETPPEGIDPPHQASGMAQARAEARERAREERRREELARFREQSITRAMFKHGRLTYLVKRETGQRFA
jgi:hypothetical protein